MSFGHQSFKTIISLIFTLIFIPQIEAQSQKKIPVTIAKSDVKVFQDTLKVQGTVEARSFAMVSARIPGPIESIYVDEGDRVIQNETKLFQVDSLKLGKLVEIRKQELAIAKCALNEKKARFKQVKADLKKSKADLERFRLLWESNSISKDDFEKVQLKYQVSQASLEHAQTLIELSKETLNKAKLALSIAQKDLQDSTIYAPISGKVSMRLHEPGEMASPGRPILRIENTQKVEISAHLPARYYSKIKIGQTKAEIYQESTKVSATSVVFKSPTINPKLRTFEIKCFVPNAKKDLIPGMLADVNLIIETKKSIGVPRESLIQRQGRVVVFIAQKNNTARMETVTTGLTSNNWIEVTSDNIKQGEAIITQGHYLLNDKQSILIKQQEK
jgi:multidrug efflux pump subunit AcrA (membrane-fusion protein)